MSLKTTLWRVAGLVLCSAVFAGTALAGDNGAPGRSGEAPGQEKKEEQAAQPTQPGNSENAPGQEQKAEVQAASEVKVEAKAEATAASEGQQQKAERQEAKADEKAERKPAKPEQAAKPEHAAKPEGARGQSALAHHHVIICHRTGSESNPYVVINIPLTAWTHAHSDTTGAHPDLNGRHDLMLKDPASRPGSKDGFSKSDCEAPSGAAPAITTTTTTTTTAPGGQTVLSAQTPAVGNAPTTAPGGASPEASGVAGAVSAAQGSQDAQPAGGTLGETAQAAKSLGTTATTGTLPFTGIPLWIAALIGAALLAAGLTLRRSA